MERIGFVTGSDRGLGLALCTELLEQGWKIYAGQYMSDWPDLTELTKRYPNKLHLIPLDVTSMESIRSAAAAVAERSDHIDMMINNAGIIAQANPSIREAQDYEDMHRIYDVNALGPLRIVEAFLPLMDRGSFKRLCFVSSEAGSITRSDREAEYAYCMSKSALNMGVKILFNNLHPEGYTFRVYHPGWIRSYITLKIDPSATYEPAEAGKMAIPIFLSQRSDEARLRLEDYEGNEWPW